MRLFAVTFAAISFAGLHLGAVATGTSIAPKPVLVELFTSEGCSSCPPADTYLQQLDEQQPIPNALLIVLSEHVDYYNQDGWMDPYSASRYTSRQDAYARVHGLVERYTPEIVVDGTYDIWTKTSQQMEAALNRAALAPKIPVRILSVTVGHKIPELQAEIDVDGTQLRHNADIYAAVALDHAASNVLRGENSRQHLTHVAVAEVLKPVGKVKKGEKVHTQVALKLDSDAASKDLRLIIFVQESGMGKVVGAALKKNIQ
jgi:hypothetical protein